MSSLIHADIFFFIAAIATVALAITFLVLLVMTIQFMARLNRISRKVEEHVEIVCDDVMELREGIRTRMEVLGNSAFAQFVLSLLGAFLKQEVGTKKKRSRSTKKKSWVYQFISYFYIHIWLQKNQVAKNHTTN